MRWRPSLCDRSGFAGRIGLPGQRRKPTYFYKAIDHMERARSENKISMSMNAAMNKASTVI
jgi:hypothetical protein